MLLGGTMRRREFIWLIGSVGVWPLAARAQQTSGAPRIGFVYPGPKAAVASRVEALVRGLREADFNAPAQVEIVVRNTDGDPALIEPMVKEVIDQQVNVFVANGPPVLQVIRKIAGAIPIVAIDLESDPVASGIAASLAHPGGNITGLFMDFPDFTAKWLQLLLECNSSLSRVAILWDPVTGPVQLEAVKSAAASMKIQSDVFEVRGRIGFRTGVFGGKPTRRGRDGDLIVAVDCTKRIDSSGSCSSSSSFSHHPLPGLCSGRRIVGLWTEYPRPVPPPWPPQCQSAGGSQAR
jgi:ABC transporter substrate binding protein